MIAIRTKDLSPLFSDLLGLRKFLKSIPGVSLVTSPGDGIDWELSGAIPEGVTVYSLIPHFIDSDLTIKSHCLSLGVSEIIPLFKVSKVTGELPEDYDMLGIYDVSGVEDIQEFIEKTGKTPDIVRLSINPLKYPKDLLDHCRTSGIEILGTDIFGESLWKEYYKTMFPETFLQSFGEYNTDIIEIPGEDPYFIRRVYSRLGKGSVESKILEYSKSIDRVPVLPLPGKMIYQSLGIKISGVGDITLEAEGGNFSLSKVKEEINLGEPIWEDTMLPGDIDSEDKELLGTLHRYHVIPKLQEETLWKPIFTKILPDFWAIKMIPKSWLGWLWKEHYYWLISGKLYEIPLSGAEILNNR